MIIQGGLTLFVIGDTMPLPPSLAAEFIVATYPELLLLTADSPIPTYITHASTFSAFQQSIESQGAPTKNSGWAYTKSIPGSTLSRLELSPTTIANLPTMLSPVLDSVMQDSKLKGLSWTVQSAITPGEQTEKTDSNGWTLTTLNPRNGVVIVSVKYSASAPASFSIELKNDIPRHLAVYAQFRHKDNIVKPTDWVSQLPGGVTADFESDTVKFVSILTPDTAVAGLAASNTSQSLTIPLPSNADSIELIVGGIGNGQWSALMDTAGVMLTVIFDYAIPVILHKAEDTNSISVTQWFQGLLTDQKIQADILNAGNFILNDKSISDVSTLLTVLSEQIPALMLGDGLTNLRENINSQIGNNAVENAAPYLGWSTQTLKALLDTQTTTQNQIVKATSQLLSITPSFSLALSPTSAFNLALTVLPDPTYGAWPLKAKSYQIGIAYANGFSQQKTGTSASRSDDIVAHFANITNAGNIAVTVKILGQDGRVLASAEGQIDPDKQANQWQLADSLAVKDKPVVLGADSRYQHYATLQYSNNSYQWDLSTEQPVATSLPTLDPNQSALTALVAIAVQAVTNSLAITWAASGQGIQNCTNGSNISIAYLFQNLGIVDPNLPQSLLDCGFIQQPFLTGSQSELLFVDPRHSGQYLRPISSNSGTFKLSDDLSFGKFRESNLNSVVLHPAGYAIGVSNVNNRLEIITLSAVPESNANTPLSQLYAGSGSRTGLLDAPVAVTITPDGIILVLENGNRRIQAFDVFGNPVAAFDGSPFLELKSESESESGSAYLDLAVSSSGTIYVLSNNGTNPTNFHLDLYNPDGSFLTRSNGINASKIAVDSRQNIYTLNYAAITGANAITQPSISIWIPS